MLALLSKAFAWKNRMRWRFDVYVMTHRCIWKMWGQHFSGGAQQTLGGQYFFKRLRENTGKQIPGFVAEATNPGQRRGLPCARVQCVRDPQGTKSDTAGPVSDTGLAGLRIARAQICLPPGPQAQCLWSRCCSHCAPGSAMRLRARLRHHN
jgi:hypothetical protein